MAKFLKLESGSLLNLDRIDRVQSNTDWRDAHGARNEKYPWEVFQSCDATTDSEGGGWCGMGITQRDYERICVHSLPL